MLFCSERQEEINNRTSTSLSGAIFLEISYNYKVESDLVLEGPRTLDRSQNYRRWNQELRRYFHLFASSHGNEITVIIYSSYDTFNRVLDDPELYGFTRDDVDKKGGAIWHDDLHPTSAMHDIIAKDIAQLLGDQQAAVVK
jgi:phospholipase/lecithinase/hemolysin